MIAKRKERKLYLYPMFFIIPAFCLALFSVLYIPSQSSFSLRANLSVNTSVNNVNTLTIAAIFKNNTIGTYGATFSGSPILVCFFESQSDAFAYPSLAVETTIFPLHSYEQFFEYEFSTTKSYSIIIASIFMLKTGSYAYYKNYQLANGVLNNGFAAL